MNDEYSIYIIVYSKAPTTLEHTVFGFYYFWFF